MAIAENTSPAAGNPERDMLHRLSADVYTARTGAQSFIQVLQHLKASADADDGRDYAELVDKLQASITGCLQHPSHAHRQGYVRALCDVLCVTADECTLPRDWATAWDPLAASALDFEGARA